MPPIILSTTPAGDGLAVVVVSARPGERVQLVVPDPGLHGQLTAATLEFLVSLADRKGTL